MGVSSRRPVLLGQRLPSLHIKTTEGALRLPDDRAGGWLLLFTLGGTSAGLTPSSIQELEALDRQRAALDELGGQVLGLAVHAGRPPARWFHWLAANPGASLGFPLGAITTAAARALGVVVSGAGPSRSTLLVDPAGVVRMILHHPPEVDRDPAEAVRVLAALRALEREDAVAESHAASDHWPGQEEPGWDTVDEAAWESFPASDPPGW